MNELNIKKIEEGIGDYYKIRYSPNHDDGHFDITGGDLDKLLNLSIDKLCEIPPPTRLVLAIEGKINSDQHNVIKNMFKFYLEEQKINVTYVIRA